MKKNVILNVVTRNNNIATQVIQKDGNTHYEFVNEVETAIEKLHQLPVRAILLDQELPLEEQEKINKIGKLLHEGLPIATADFLNAEGFSETVQELKRAIVKQNMKKYEFEDNPNLNNPFLNMNRTQCSLSSK